MEFVVNAEEHGLTLLAFLKQKCEGISVKKLKKAIDAKLCKVNGKTEFFSSFLLREGDLVALKLEDFSKTTFSDIQTIYEDKDFLVVNKPPGLISTDEEFAKVLKGKKARLVHRLDKETSGLILLAKNPLAEKSAKDLFAKREIEKLYLAVVEGTFKGSSAVIDNYLGKKGAYQGQTLYGSVKAELGLRAITHFQVLKKGKEASLLLCDLKTGRTHQIRVHLSEKGYPILGDHQYAKKAFSSAFMPQRHLLHAWKLSFSHPFTEKKIELDAPLPNDFVEALKMLSLDF